MSEGEKSGWYSHTLLWIKCAMENKDIAIIEHDVECVAPLDFTERGLNFFVVMKTIVNGKTMQQDL